MCQVRGVAVHLGMKKDTFWKETFFRLYRRERRGEKILLRNIGEKNPQTGLQSVGCGQKRPCKKGNEESKGKGGCIKEGTSQTLSEAAVEPTIKPAVR